MGGKETDLQYADTKRTTRKKLNLEDMLEVVFAHKGTDGDKLHVIGQR